VPSRISIAAHLVRRLKAQISEALAIECVVHLVPLHTLPRTSSGKLSRSEARRNFLRARASQPLAPADDFGTRAGEPTRRGRQLSELPSEPLSQAL
jgi:hypothetical protein